jgi:hypothetical protein
MDEASYTHVVENNRTPDGLLFGLPVVMDTRDESLKPGVKVRTLSGCPLNIPSVFLESLEPGVKVRTLSGCSLNVPSMFPDSL